MKEINQYISEKLIVNNTIQNSSFHFNDSVNNAKITLPFTLHIHWFSHYNRSLLNDLDIDIHKIKKHKTNLGGYYSFFDKDNNHILNIANPPVHRLLTNDKQKPNVKIFNIDGKQPINSFGEITLVDNNCIEFINEKLMVNNTIQAYKYCPTSLKTLIKCIKEKIKNEGLGTKNHPLNLNDIDTSQVTNMNYLFSAGDYDKLKELSENGYFDISKWDVSKVEDMYGMFYKSNFDGDLSKWNVGKVTNMGHMFNRSKFTGKNGDISNWDISNVEDMDYMFYGSDFNGNINKWKPNNMIKYKDYVFDCCPLQNNPPKWYKE